MNDKSSKPAGDEPRENTDQLAWYKPEDPTPREQCPCCDYISLPERCTYLICPICFWEDDGSDVDDLYRQSGPNHMRLCDGRENFLRFGACDETMLNNVLPVAERNAYEHRPRKP